MGKNAYHYERENLARYIIKQKEYSYPQFAAYFPVVALLEAFTI